MNISQEELERLKNNVRQDYNQINEVHCPYFGEKVKFASDGYKHLLFKHSFNVRERQEKEQQMRLKLFKLAPKLLKITTTVQEFSVENQFVPSKTNKRREMVMKEVKYWGFIAILDHRKIKVVVKQIGDGFKRFWSIILDWITRKSDKRFLQIHHSGDPKND